MLGRARQSWEGAEVKGHLEVRRSVPAKTSEGDGGAGGLLEFVERVVGSRC